jgi:hypothetical protein
VNTDPRTGLVRGAAQRDMRRAKGKLVVHFFSHQGQARALLTAQGQDSGDTDLFLMVPDADRRRRRPYDRSELIGPRNQGGGQPWSIIPQLTCRAS